MTYTRFLTPMLCAVATLMMAAPQSAQSEPDKMSSPAKFVYIGTYTGKGSEGIYRFKFDAAAGKLTLMRWLVG
jgi:hypothetical protein